MLGLFSLIGLVLLGVALYVTDGTREFVASAAIASGEVIDLIESRDSDGDSIYRPRVQFQTPDGRRREFTATVAANPAGFYAGEAVEVLYDPVRPSTARIDTFFQLWFTPLLLGGMGATFTLFGLLGFSAGHRQQSDATGPAPRRPPTESEQTNANEQAAEGKPSLADRGRVIDRIERD